MRLQLRAMQAAWCRGSSLPWVITSPSDTYPEGTCQETLEQKESASGVIKITMQSSKLALY
eukprot:scaffold278904_cov19-Prasinocladus_malaysianus.AAC.3